MTEVRIATPCTGVCTLNKEKICIGCFRTNTEIAQWRASNDDVRRDIIVRAEERKAANQ